MEAKELLVKAGLDWTVRMESIMTTSGVGIEDHMAIIRDDTNDCLSIRKDGYHPYQNHQLMDVLFNVSKQTGLDIHSGGYFGKGGKVYVQLKSSDLQMPKGDRVEGYVTGINSFDGSTSLAFGNSTKTISCANTFFAAYREIKSKVRHTRNMLNKVDEICFQLDKNINQEKKMFERIKRMTEVKMDDSVKNLVIQALFDIDAKIPPKEWLTQLPKVTTNRIERFEIDLNTELAQKDETLWGLFSGVTRFTTHSISKNDNTEAKLFGVYGNRERKIFSQLEEMVLS